LDNDDLTITLACPRNHLRHWRRAYLIHFQLLVSNDISETPLDISDIKHFVIAHLCAT